MTLRELREGESGIIRAVLTDESARIRLYDLGFTPGTTVKRLFPAPSGDPRAYLVRGAVLALRKSEAGLIVLEEKPNAEIDCARGESQRREKHGVQRPDRA